MAKHLLALRDSRFAGYAELIAVTATVGGIWCLPSWQALVRYPISVRTFSPKITVKTRGETRDMTKQGAKQGIRYGFRLHHHFVRELRR